MNRLIGDTAENQQQGQHHALFHEDGQMRGLQLNPDNGHESDPNGSDIDESDRELFPSLDNIT